MNPGLLSPPRFEHPLPIGEGAMGVVEKAFDPTLGAYVAVKRLRAPSPEQLLQLKREFRALADLRHPNLVRVFELGEDAAGAYFSMELVDGGDLAAHVRREGRASLPKLLPQLLDALEALHARGIVHRDLKPANVLVTRSGTVKVCDFGLLTALGVEPGQIAGSPAYMAPEQAKGQAASAATDAYALGVLLYELSAGRLPFTGSVAEVLEAHERQSPADPRALAPELDAAWAAMILALLAKSPSDRPTIAALRGMFGAASEVTAERPTELLGRAELLGRLREALSPAGAPVVSLSGPSGVGKSALLKWIEAYERGRGRVVLTGRTHIAERVAFNALDGVIDQLALALRGDPRRLREHEDDLALAAPLFPVLALTAKALRERDRGLVKARLFGGAHEGKNRRPLFAAIARLLERLDAVSVLVDDVQWADDDSIALLTALVEARGPGVRFVLATRDEVPPPWLTGLGARSIEVEPLRVEDTRALVRRASRGARLSDAAVNAAAVAADGRPFVAEVLGRALSAGAAVDVMSPLDTIVRALDPRACSALLSIVVADDPMPLELLGALSGAKVGEVLERVLTLEDLGLVRRGRASGGSVTAVASHHSVHAALTRVTPADRVRDEHARFCSALSERDDVPIERRVRHLVGAGRVTDAARAARTAATHATERGAYSLAADMLEIAMQDGGADLAELARRRVEALERAGRYRDAAEAWPNVIARSTPAEKMELGARHAHALIAANRSKEGLLRLDAALASAGEGPTIASRAAEIASVLSFVIGPMPWRGRPRPQRPELLLRGRRDAKIGVLLAFLEPLTGIRYLQRARRTFRAAGAEELVALTEYNFAVLAHAGDPSWDVPSLAARWARSAASRVEISSASPELRGMPPFLEGLAALRRGAWVESKARFAESLAIFEHAEGTTERMMAASWGMMGDVYLQDLRAMKAHVAWFWKQLARVGETIIIAHVELLAAYVHVLDGDYEAARRTTDQLAAMFDGDRPNTQRGAALLYRHLPNVYSGDPTVARREYASAFAEAARYRFVQSLYGGPIAGIGALVEANALRVKDPLASAKRVEALARAVDRAPPLWAGVSWRARAYAADAVGRASDAIAHLERAEQEAERFHRPIDAAIARFQRARRQKDEASMAEARARLEATGAHPSLLEEDAGYR